MDPDRWPPGGADVGFPPCDPGSDVRDVRLLDPPDRRFLVPAASRPDRGPILGMVLGLGIPPGVSL